MLQSRKRILEDENEIRNMFTDGIFETSWNYESFFANWIDAASRRMNDVFRFLMRKICPHSCAFKIFEPRSDLLRWVISDLILPTFSQLFDSCHAFDRKKWCVPYHGQLQLFRTWLIWVSSWLSDPVEQFTKGCIENCIQNPKYFMIDQRVCL